MAHVVGLTGGIGSGKSTVLAMLAERGATVIDADAIVHELQRSGTDVFKAMVSTFGDEIVGPDGELDRPKVASIVFNDPEQLKQLNAIVHPEVGKVVLERLASAGEHGIVVIDIPLLTENTRAERGLRSVVVVDVSPSTQVERAVARGGDRPDVESRIASQASREDRLQLADHVIDNEGSLSGLQRQVDELWSKLVAEASS
ncbi:MAG: dephospho-CoA kinase [Actinomycetota bacterium]